MAVFTNIDIKSTREKLKMTAATLAEIIGCDPSTVYNYESGKATPDPDVMYQIAVALGDLNIWHRWMRTKYPSYARMHPENSGYSLQAAFMAAMPELHDVLHLQDQVGRDLATGSIDDPALRAKLIKETNEALAALQNLAIRLSDGEK